MIDTNNNFTRMQQSVYDQLAVMDSDRNRNGNPLQEYDRYYEERMWRYIPDLNSKAVLDFGCGPGRNLIYYTGKVKSIDGVDISVGNLVTARQWLQNNNFNVDSYKLYKNDGISLNGIPDQVYDVVMSTIVLQHISVYKIRYNLLSEFYRVLKPNGYVTLQFLYSTDKSNTVGYFDNPWDVQGTNGANDCVVGDASHVVKDLESLGFGNIQYFVDQAYTTGGVPPRSTDDKEWLFVTGQKV
jgi:2-polyprenyl-3-methyl-5-hydroxy-6-metoxy-1,4-benzoquinol methylase